MALVTAKLSVILSRVSFMLSVIDADECRKKPIILTVIMLSVVMPSVVAPATYPVFPPPTDSGPVL